MSDLILNMLILSFLLVLASSGTTSATSKPSPRTLSTSSSFCRYFSLRLPANETTVAGKDLEWCPQNHVPDSQFKLQLRL